LFYLYGSLYLVFHFLLLLLIRPDLKRQGLIPALLFIPYGPISELLYMRDYWSPQPVLPPFVIFGQPFLSEDLIFSFAIVGIMSLAYDVTFRKKPVAHCYRPRPALATLLSVIALALFIGLALGSNLNSIFVGSLVAVVCALPMLILRPDLWPVALGSSLVIGLSAALFYFIILSLPGATAYLLEVWKLPLEQAALHIFGVPIPLTEVFWAFATAFYFGIVYKFAVGSGYKAN
jgi:hypothetical protein